MPPLVQIDRIYYGSPLLASLRPGRWQPLPDEATVQWARANRQIGMATLLTRQTCGSKCQG